MRQDNETTQPSSSQVLGRYQVLRRIGKGGMGDVWLAEDPSLRRQVAIKTLPTHSQNDREFSMRFAREAQAAAALNHPHILSIHDFGEQPLVNGQSITYIVMPYVSGGSLADRITSYATTNAGMPAQEAISYLQQAAEAIDYAHSQRVVHRDIKPGNMLLRPDNWLLLADFGIARILSSQEQMTQAGVGIGTPEYMAPEQAQGRPEAASDNYSLAVVAYQLFTGRLPFTADTGYAITIQHLITPPPPPRQYNPHLSPAFEAALLQGLAKEPAQRPQSAQAFVAGLQRTLTGELTYIKPSLPATLAVPISTPDIRGTLPETVVGPTTQANKQIVSRRTLLIGGAAAVLAIGGVGTWAIASHGKTTPQNPNTTNSSPSNTPSSAPDPNAPVLTIRAHNKPVSSLRWSPTAGNVLISAGSNGDGQTFLWDINALVQSKQKMVTDQQSTQKQKFDTASDLLLAWSPDGTMLAVGNTAFSIDPQQSIAYTVYKSDMGTPVEGYENPVVVAGLDIQALGWLNANKIAAIVNNGNFDIHKPSTQLSLWDITQPTLQPTPFLLTTDVLTASGVGLVNEKLLAVSPDGSLLAIALSNGVRIGSISVSGTKVGWAPHPDILTFTTDGSIYEADAVAWSPTGNEVLGLKTGYSDSSKIAEWNPQSPKQSPGILKPPDADIMLTTLVHSPKPGSTFIASGSKNGTISIWDASKGGLPEHTLQGPNAEITSLGWSADQKWFAASYNDTNASILIWNAEELR